eukprot:SAG31_NODE_21451_length_549_cov_1.024444_1_plen_158_part_01
MTAVALLLQLLCWPLVAAAQSHAALGQCPTVTHAMRSAEQLCGGAPVADSLWSVGIGDGGAAVEALLKKNGLRTALDLRVLRAGGPEEAATTRARRAKYDDDDSVFASASPSSSPGVRLAAQHNVVWRSPSPENCSHKHDTADCTKTGMPFGNGELAA